MEYPEFKVCVRCFTYNQAAYITETMDGFVSQQTDFPFVCCIVDDASTDGEQDVIKAYLESNFDLSEGSCHFESETEYANITYARHKTNTSCHFTVLYLKENLYSRKEDRLKYQYLAEWERNCRYVAICEGDDYWTDPSKIKKQSEFLDSHPQHSLIYSRVRVLDGTSNEWKSIKGKACDTFIDLAYSNHIPTLSTMMRLDCWKDYYAEVQPDERDWKAGDYPIWLWMALHHKIHFEDKITGVYRLLVSSMSHTGSIEKGLEYSESIIDIVRYFIDNGDLSQREKSRILGYRYVMIARGMVDRGRYDLARKYAGKISPDSPVNLLMKIIYSSRLTMLIYRSYRKYRYK